MPLGLGQIGGESLYMRIELSEYSEIFALWWDLRFSILKVPALARFALNEGPLSTMEPLWRTEPSSSHKMGPWSCRAVWVFPPLPRTWSITVVLECYFLYPFTDVSACSWEDLPYLSELPCKLIYGSITISQFLQQGWIPWASQVFVPASFCDNAALIIVCLGSLSMLMEKILGNIQSHGCSTC